MPNWRRPPHSSSCSRNSTSCGVDTTRVGVISDTHGLLRPEALAFIAGCDHIIHAGDVCDGTVLEKLAAIAPVTAVRGNNDTGAWAAGIKDVERLRIEGVAILVIHDLAQLKPKPGSDDVQVVIAGHSHKPLVDRRDGVLYLNPGSAGPRRFKLPVAVGELIISGSKAEARIQLLAF